LGFPAAAFTAAANWVAVLVCVLAKIVAARVELPMLMTNVMVVARRSEAVAARDTPAL